MAANLSTEYKLSIIAKDGSYLLDSRVLAERLGYEHETVARSIKRHKPRLEAKSVLRQFVGEPPQGSRGGRPEVYWMLDERQCLILTGYLKKGTEADDWHDHLVDAFLDARSCAQELQRKLLSVRESTHTFLKTLQMRAETLLDAVQDLEFLPLCELAREGYRWEELLNACLDPDARLERSVERCWWNYARTVLHVEDHVRRKCTRRGPDGRRVRIWAYPIELLTAFRRWLAKDYFPEKFQDYQRNRARRIAKQQQISTKDVQMLPQSEVAQSERTTFALA